MKTILISLMIGLGLVATSAAAGQAEKKFTAAFSVDKSDLASRGHNQYFSLEPGAQSVLEGQEKGKITVLTVTVLNQTKRVDGVETRVVEEKETVDGELVEISRNYFALSRKTSDVFYFGEDVDIYEKGKIVSHEGAWLSGVKGAQFGMMMPGAPVVGACYQQEVAPKVALDRAEIVSLSETVMTPVGRFDQCLKTEETSELESGTAYKVYAPSVGLVLDGTVKLKTFTRPPQSANTGTQPNAQQTATASPANQEPSLANDAVPVPMARFALSFVGADPEAEAVWVNAINDPRLPAKARQDLIEDLNEDGFLDPRNPTLDDLPLMLNRLWLIEALAPDAMDAVNAAAFQEAYKDLVNMVVRVKQP